MGGLRDTGKIMNCPDCNEKGGFGKRCLKHEIEYLEMEISQMMKKRELLLKMKQEQEHCGELKTGGQD